MVTSAVAFLVVISLSLSPFQTKYTLMDKRDITLVNEYTFEARTEVDKNGCGATIFAFAYVFEKGRYGKMSVCRPSE